MIAENGTIHDMTSEPSGINLPAQIADAISGIPKALIPASIKALDRLVGGSVDIPVAWLAQKKAKIEAQTQAYAAVELAISNAVSAEAGAAPEIIQQAMTVLIRKEYRKQTNRNAVGQAALEDLRASDAADVPSETREPVDEDWLNIFERYAEDASTERMQNLWGRVLSGEIRKSGSYSMRTLRFLSEFSQAEALLFTDFCQSAFGYFAPKNLVKCQDEEDIRPLLDLEAAGLIKGVTGNSLYATIKFGDNGRTTLNEGILSIVFIGEPNKKLSVAVVPLTALGQELLQIIPGRDRRAAANKLANALKMPEIEEAYLVKADRDGSKLPIEIFWQAPPADIDLEIEDPKGL